MKKVFLAASALLLCACPPGGGGGGSDAQTDAPEDAPPESGEDAAVDATSGDGADAGADGSLDGMAGGDATLDSTTSGDSSTDTGTEAATEGGATCAFDAGTLPEGAMPTCGDGVRESTEECDDGLGNANPTRRGCSAQCQVVDELAVWQTNDAGALSNSPRTLGAGRHPIASSDSTFGVVYLEPNSTPLTLSLATFGAKGAATGIINPFGALSTVVDNSNPVVAGLGCGKYAVAWADFNSEAGDELDVALRIVDPSTPVTTPPAHANTTLSFSQFDPDIVWTGSQLVVAWVDTSNPATEPDLMFRTFDSNFSPTSGEQTLAGTADLEADVALAPFAGSWAAAWRDDTVGDASGLETIQVQAGTAKWTVGPEFLPAPVAAKPALTQLDATHLLVVYAVGADTTDSGVANGSILMAAVLDTVAPGNVSGTTVLGMVPGRLVLDQSTPSAVNVQGSIWISWWTAAALGDPLGEELWLKSVGWNGSALDLTQVEMPLPRWPQARLGDQKAPALAASTLPPGGGLVTAWTDLGGGIALGEGNGDLVVELVPVPPLRTSGDGGP